MASNIDETKPIAVTPTTQSVRDNFSTAKTEIGALQAQNTTSETHEANTSNPHSVTTVQIGALSDPMTTRGDVIHRNSSNATARLAVGASGEYLKSDGTDPSWGGVSASDVDHLAITGSTHNSENLQTLGHSSGVVTASTASDIDTLIQAGTGLYVTVKAFGCYLRTSASVISDLYYCDVPAVPDVTLQATTSDTNYHILVTWVSTSSAPTVSISTSDTSNGCNIIKLGEVYNDGGSIHEIINYPDKFNDHAFLMNQRNFDINGMARATGAVVGEANAGVDLSVSVSASTWWAKSTKITLSSALDSNAGTGGGNGDGSFTLHHNTAGAWAETTSQTVLPTSYDDGTDLVTLTGSRYGNWWCYLGVTDFDVRFVAGTTNGSLSKAQNASAPSSLPPLINTLAYKLIGRYIVRNGTASFIEVDSAFDTTLTTSPAVSHSDLSNLTVGDDHTQYLLKTGGAFTAHPINRNITINGNPLVNQRGYVSGTPTTAANEYTLDRWRVVTSSQALTFSTTANVVTMTLPVGGIEQVIEGLNIQSGTYTISFTSTGDTVCTVDTVTKSSGDTFTLTGGTNATIKFSSASGTGTVKLIQVESGSSVTPFEHRDYASELARCQRYATVLIDSAGWTGGVRVASGTTARISLPLNVPLRDASTASLETITAPNLSVWDTVGQFSSATDPIIIGADANNKIITLSIAGFSGLAADKAGSGALSAAKIFLTNEL